MGDEGRKSHGGRRGRSHQRATLSRGPGVMKIRVGNRLAGVYNSRLSALWELLLRANYVHPAKPTCHGHGASQGCP